MQDATGSTVRGEPLGASHGSVQRGQGSGGGERVERPHLGGAAAEGRGVAGRGDRKGLRGGTGGPGRVRGGGEEGAALYIRSRGRPAAAPGPAAAIGPAAGTASAWAATCSEKPLRTITLACHHSMTHLAFSQSKCRGNYMSRHELELYTVAGGSTGHLNVLRSHLMLQPVVSFKKIATWAFLSRSKLARSCVYRRLESDRAISW